MRRLRYHPVDQQPARRFALAKLQVFISFLLHRTWAMILLPNLRENPTYEREPGFSFSPRYEARSCSQGPVGGDSPPKIWR
ncbi:hypothetical protein B0H63DRAFT_474714 [Podospora didyma]|uniref:Uncharacterized protein n=1 Tax=Podospora didyma TaxID=330526 RepID=A0AAE0NGD6_9PEZI|nr:hypothetical protein B0H63DRAFT_474714 [Podospora didyma]